MAAVNRNDRCPSARSNPTPPVNRLAERVRHYFHRHPEVSREEFLLEAVRREMHRREGPWAPARLPPSTEEIRIHAGLTERLAAFDYERHGLWPKFRRFLFGNRLVRWLGLQSQRIGAERKCWRPPIQSGSTLSLKGEVS
jgi:hypothetical protein